MSVSIIGLHTEEQSTNLFVGTRLGHLIDKFCENCVYKSIAPNLWKLKIRIIFKIFSLPVNDKPELSRDEGDSRLWGREKMEKLENREHFHSRSSQNE